MKMCSGYSKKFFHGIVKKQLLNASAKKWGYKLGAGKVVARIDTDGMIQSVKNLNSHG
jgi:proline dehydrogenase